MVSREDIDHHQGMTSDEDMHARLSKTILQVRSEWIDGTTFDVSDINCGAHPNGCCSDFVSTVYATFGGAKEVYELGISEVGIDGFMTDRGDGCLSFDRSLLAMHWPAVMPPGDLTWDDMDALSEDAGFNAGTHEWMVLEGRHYDAECPEGVDSFFDLPFFRRVVASWMIERNSTTRNTLRT
jgi:hypothetical protein